ncbi:unnamed protein product, partial [Iphiclides podalirius]
MPKKKGQNKKKNNQALSDFTLNDCANAPKPVARVTKLVTTESVVSNLSWDEIFDNDLDIVEEVDADGSKSIVFKKKRNHSKTELEDVENRPGSSHWSVYFKLKKLQPMQRIEMNKNIGFIEELSRIDANPDEDSQVLQVTCQNFYEVPPLMGMTLSSVSVVLSQGFRHRRLHLGFNTGDHNVSKNILPECSVVLDTVINIYVFDWWHPKYPHFDNQLPLNVMDDESVPVLKTDFFTVCNGDL